MLKAKELTEQAVKASFTKVPVSGAADLEVNDQVCYKDGHELEGVTALVIDKRQDSVDLRVGNATKMEVPYSDLMKLSKI